MIFHIGWPQGLLLALFFIHLLIHAGRDGEDMKEKYRFGIAVLRVALYCGLLYWGGFFNGAN